MGGGHGDLLAAAARGDDEALAVLVRAYHDRVYRFGLRVCRDGYDADDAVQEAFTKLAKRPEVQRDAGVLSWLMSVVRNACLRMLRPFVREHQSLGERLHRARPSSARSCSAAVHGAAKPGRVNPFRGAVRRPISRRERW